MNDQRQLTVLHLFAGAGGGILADILNGHRIVGAVEWEEYPCRVLEARQDDGILPSFPIWRCDIRDFNEVYADAYSGVVDIVAGGWPCQPHSVAGKKLGAEDPREGWPYFREAIRIIQPRWVFGENVRGMLSTDDGRYFRGILRDLSDLGYDAAWQVVSASDVGAPHRRDRLWIVANSSGTGAGD